MSDKIKGWTILKNKVAKYNYVKLATAMYAIDNVIIKVVNALGDFIKRWKTIYKAFKYWLIVMGN